MFLFLGHTRTVVELRLRQEHRASAFILLQYIFDRQRRSVPAIGRGANTAQMHVTSLSSLHSHLNNHLECRQEYEQLRRVAYQSQNIKYQAAQKVKRCIVKVENETYNSRTRNEAFH